MYRSHVLVCGGAGCTSAGSKDILMALETEIEKNGLTEEVSVVQTSCHGMCALGPLMIVHPEGSLYPKITVENIKEIVEEHLVNGRVVKHLLYKETAAQEAAVSKEQPRIALRNCGVIDPENIEEYLENGGYEALGRVLCEMKPDDVIAAITDSGLRERGSGDFPTGTKWKLARENEADQKYVCCTADEGDPNAFIDRSVLEGDPHVVLEAMAIAGYAIGATQGYISVPDEYTTAVQHLTTALEQAREYGYLGENIFGTDFAFDIDLRLGAGTFVCDEGTALMTSLDGNVETYANIPQIILSGAD